MGLVLRPYQTRLINSLFDAIRQGQRPVGQIATGGGKTACVAKIFELGLRKNKRMAFCVPFLSLISQTWRAFELAGIDPREMAVIQGQNELTDWSKPIQIVSCDTLIRRPVLPEVDLVVWDEVHRNSGLIGRWMQEAPGAAFCGISATPWAMHLKDHFDRLIIAATTRELIDDGYLSPYRLFAPSSPDLSGVRITAGDYNEGDLSGVMNQPKLVADVVTTWLKMAERRPTFVFAVDCAHAKSLQEQFQIAGVAAGYVDAYTPVEEREAMVAQLGTGHLEVICNIGTMTTGVDAPFVSCIVLARPTRSEMLYIQIVGRGLRTFPGKTDCLARGTMILTDKGEVRIEDVTLDHKLWDGVEFVPHSGAVCKGLQSVIEYDGILATPDHRVMTNEGWETLAQAACHGRRIARTGFAGIPTRFVGDCKQEGGWGKLESARRSSLRQMQADAHDEIPQYEKAARDRGVRALQSSDPCVCPEMALSSLPGSATALLQSIRSSLQRLRRAWSSFFIRGREPSGALDSGKFRNSSGQKIADRPYRQFRTLPAWESAMVTSCRECEQFAESRLGKQKQIYPVQEEISSYQICGQHACGPDTQGHVGGGDCRKMGIPILQTEREVWDILNAGPLQRFTANGRLVHNCLVLDHSDTALTLGLPDEIEYEDFPRGDKRQGDAEKKEKLPKKCPACNYLKPVGVQECPLCGFKPEQSRSKIVCEEGELLELGYAGSVRGKKKTKEEFTRQMKQEWWAQILYEANRKGRSRGWASHIYKDKFGVWPNGLIDHPSPPSTQVLNFIRSRAIAFAKSRARQSA